MQIPSPKLFNTVLCLCLIILLSSNSSAQTTIPTTPQKFSQANIKLSDENLLEMNLQKERFKNLNPELHKISSDIVQLLKPELLPSATSLEEHAFSFQQMNALRLDMTQS